MYIRNKLTILFNKSENLPKSKLFRIKLISNNIEYVKQAVLL